MAAAVSDYMPENTSERKIKKSDSKLTIHLKPTQDILKWAGANRTDQFMVGFALEDRAIKKRAQEKMAVKNLDMIIVNTPSAISSASSQMSMKIRDNNWVDLEDDLKTRTAERIISEIRHCVKSTHRKD